MGDLRLVDAFRPGDDALFRGEGAAQLLCLRRRRWRAAARPYLVMKALLPFRPFM